MKLVKLKKETLEKIGYRETYDLEIDDKNHNFVLANNIVTSNSHSNVYSAIAMMQIYLRMNYPEEFYAVALSANDVDVMYSHYITDSMKRGVKVLPPDIKKSRFSFYPTGDKEVVCSLKVLKGLGETAYKELSQTSRDWNDICDFLLEKWSKFNKKAMEAVIATGALRSLEPNVKLTQKLYEYHSENKANLGKTKKLTKAVILEKIEEQLTLNPVTTKEKFLEVLELNVEDAKFEKQFKKVTLDDLHKLYEALGLKEDTKYSEEHLRKRYKELQEAGIVDYTERELDKLWFSICSFSYPFRDKFSEYRASFDAYGVVPATAWEERFNVVYGEVEQIEEKDTANKKSKFRTIHINDGFGTIKFKVFENQFRENAEIENLEIGSLICAQLTKHEIYGFNFSKNGSFIVLN